jgi:acyl-CoA thioesterase
MIGFDVVTGSIARDGDQFAVQLPPCWMQGRTAFGGASAALALAAVLEAYPDLPPLRSGQFAFVGPLGGSLEIQPSILRKGRSATFVRADVAASGTLGLAAIFLFAGERNSEIDFLPARHPDLPVRGEAIAVPAEVAFAQNFELATAGDRPSDAPRLSRWARLKQQSRLPQLIQLVLVADVLPAAALMLSKGLGPISTMTWQLDMIAPAPSSRDGWWLVSAEAAVAQRGFSSQSMQIWNDEGELVATATQTVALFI